MKICGTYVIMCDEELSYKTEKLSLCVRYLEGLVKVKFLKFVNSSASDELEISNLSLIGQLYDKAAVMSINTGGLQTKDKGNISRCLIYTLFSIQIELRSNGLLYKHPLQHFLTRWKYYTKTVLTLYIMQNFLKELHNRPRESSQLSNTRCVCSFKSRYAEKTAPKLLNILESKITIKTDTQSVNVLGILTNIKQSFTFSI